MNTGIKYYRITGDTDDKQPYVRAWRWKGRFSRGQLHVQSRKQVEYLHDFMGRKPLIIAPMTPSFTVTGGMKVGLPELFIRKSAFDQKVFRLIAPSDYFREYPSTVLDPFVLELGVEGLQRDMVVGIERLDLPAHPQGDTEDERACRTFPGQNGWSDAP